MTKGVDKPVEKRKGNRTKRSKSKPWVGLHHKRKWQDKRGR